MHQELRAVPNVVLPDLISTTGLNPLVHEDEWSDHPGQECARLKADDGNSVEIWLMSGDTSAGQAAGATVPQPLISSLRLSRVVHGSLRLFRGPSAKPVIFCPRQSCASEMGVENWPLEFFKRAFARGELSRHELDERLSLVLAARIRNDLRPALEDLEEGPRRCGDTGWTDCIRINVRNYCPPFYSTPGLGHLGPSIRRDLGQWVADVLSPWNWAQWAAGSSWP